MIIREAEIKANRSQPAEGAWEEDAFDGGKRNEALRERGLRRLDPSQRPLGLVESNEGLERYITIWLDLESCEEKMVIRVWELLLKTGLDGRQLNDLA